MPWARGRAEDAGGRSGGVGGSGRGKRHGASAAGAEAAAAPAAGEALHRALAAATPAARRRRRRRWRPPQARHCSVHTRLSPRRRQAIAAKGHGCRWHGLARCRYHVAGAARRRPATVSPRAPAPQRTTTRRASGQHGAHGAAAAGPLQPPARLAEDAAGAGSPSARSTAHADPVEMIPPRSEHAALRTSAVETECLRSLQHAPPSPWPRSSSGSPGRAGPRSDRRRRQVTSHAVRECVS